MATLSELNKEEREIKGKISSLRRDMRDKKIDKKRFDSQFERYSRKLEGISEKKNKLIGLPPIPPAPKPSGQQHAELGDIKKAVGSGSIEPPEPPTGSSSPGKGGEQKESPPQKGEEKESPPQKGEAKESPPQKKPASRKKPGPKKAAKKAVKDTAPSPKPEPATKVVTREVPVYKERIKRVEVPVIRERIKRVEVPVIKEKIKKVPVVKTVEVPRDDPKMAKKLGEAFKEVSDLKLDVSRHDQEYSQIAGQLKSLQADIDRLEELKSGLKALEVTVRNIQTSEEGRAAGSEEVKALQSDMNKTEREITRLSGEVQKLTESAGEIGSLKTDVRGLKDRLGKMDFEGLGQEIYSQFKNMNQEIRQTSQRNDDAVEKLHVEMKTLKERLESVQHMEEQFERLDIPGLKRDFEALKQRNQHLEQQLSGIEIKPLVDMLKDVESRITHLQNQSALVIE